MNRITLIGHLGADPELRTTTGGKKVATLSVATTEFFKNAKGEDKKETTWHRVVGWEWMATAMNGAKKGERVFVMGRMRHDSYLDKEGATKYTSEVVAECLTRIGDE